MLAVPMALPVAATEAPAVQAVTSASATRVTSCCLASSNSLWKFAYLARTASCAAVRRTYSSARLFRASILSVMCCILSVGEFDPTANLVRCHVGPEVHDVRHVQGHPSVSEPRCDAPVVLCDSQERLGQSARVIERRLKWGQVFDCLVHVPGFERVFGCHFSGPFFIDLVFGALDQVRGSGLSQEHHG